MIPGPLRPFISDLRRATDDGRAVWDTSPFSGYTCEKGDISIAIWQFNDEETGFDVIGFRIADANGETKFYVNEHEDEFFEMRSVFASASAAANKFAVKLKGLF